MSPYNLKDSQLFLIKEDDYECDDTRLPPNVYQFFCKRGYGYLSIKKSEVEDKKSAVQVEIAKERGINIGKFVPPLLIIIQLYTINEIHIILLITSCIL